MVNAEPTQSMEEILKTLNETIAKQQAQINQLLEAQTTKAEPKPVAEPVSKPPSPPVKVTAVNITEIANNKRKMTETAKDKPYKMKKGAHAPTRMVLLQEQWDNIKIKIDVGKEEEKERAIDEAMAEKIRLLREDTLFKAKVTFACIFRGPFGDEVLPKRQLTLSCSKVRSDETETFHSADMVAPELRGYDKPARENPREALKEFKGNSLLVDRYAEIISLVGKGMRDDFICCSTKRGFISFYAPVQIMPGSFHTTLQHHITLELKHLLEDIPGARLRLLRGRLEDAADPTVKAINLVDAFKFENRAGLIVCRLHHVYKQKSTVEKRWGITFSEGDPFPGDSRTQSSCLDFGRCEFIDSVELYKKKVEGPSPEEVVEVVADDVAHADLVVLDGETQDEVVAVPVDEINNSFIPLNP